TQIWLSICRLLLRKLLCSRLCVFLRSPLLELLRSLVPELLRLQQRLLPLSPLFALSLKRLIEVSDRPDEDIGRSRSLSGDLGPAFDISAGRLDFAPDICRRL